MFDEAEKALWQEIEAMKDCPATPYEIEKVKNKFEANTLFGEINVMNKAMNLGFYAMTSDASLVNREVALYQAVTPQEIAAFSRRTFRPENSSTLLYRAKR